MRFSSFLMKNIGLSIFAAIVLTCQHVDNPFDPNDTSVSLFLKSSNGQLSETAITDTVGNTDTIGVALYLTQFIDSTIIEVMSGTTAEDTFVCKKKSRNTDTVYYTVSFSTPGERRIIATGYVKGLLNREDNAIIHVVARPQENRKPELSMNGAKAVVAGETVQLVASKSDPDAGQTVTVEAIRLPDGATFKSDTFRWATTVADIGTDTAIFVASDNGTSVLTDTDIVVIRVRATADNKPPKWTDSVIRLPGKPGVELTLTLGGKCIDPDGDELTYTLLPGTPGGDTLIDSTWTFTPAAGDTGDYSVYIVARDLSDDADTLTLNLVITANDNTAPTLKRISPEKDSQTVSSSSYQITISGQDESGIDSVKCIMESETFAVTKSADTLYSANVTDLRSSDWNSILFIATDLAPAANRCTLYVHLKYDPTLPDNVPPIITLVSPSADTVIDADSCLIRARCTDDSGVAVVNMSVGTDTVRATRGSNDLFSATVKGLAAGQYSTVFITAVDSAAGRNTRSIPAVRIKYDNDAAGPTVSRGTPAKDSVTINLPSYTITVACVDPSGVASVKGTLGSQTFNGTKGSGNNWTIHVDGLEENKVNKVTITAADSSLRANTTSINLYITYDPTIGDNIPPTLYFVKPSNDTVIGVDSIVVTAICKDASDIASLAGFRGATPFTMNKSATVDSLWTGTVKGLPSGVYATIKLVATDASSAHNTDSVSLRIKYDGDAAGPTISRVSPAGDSDATNSSSYTITVSCTDPSGVASVKGTRGSQSFNGTREAGNSWNISVSGLVANTVNMITVTATDSSLRANPSSLTFYIKYDPTMLDTIGPTIVQKTNLVSGSIVPNAAIEIVDTVGDPSGIDSVYWTKNGGAKKIMSPVAGKTDHYSLKDTISEGKSDTLMVTAVDKSTRRNSRKQIIILTYIQAPSITTQPASQTLCSGSRAIFSVSATGTAPLSYQWRTGATTFNNIPNAIYPLCTLNNVTSTTILSCVVSNGSSTSATSNLCTLTVRQPPNITGPTDQTTCSGTNTTLSVTVSGTNTYQWYSGTVGSGSTISGATSASYSTSTAGSYYCVVTSSNGCSATSSAATVTVNTTPTITGPTNKSICSGVPASLTVSASGGSGLTYQWYSGVVGSGSPISGATSASYSTSTAGSYYCVVTNSAGCSATSSAATVTVNATPIISGPASDATCTGVPVSLAVSASGGTGFTYQWYSGTVGSGSAISGATFASYSTATAGSYYCAVTNSSGCSANSAAATVTVNPAPTISGPSNRSTCPGVPVNLTVTASGGSPFTYEWYSGAVGSGTLIPSATSATYSTATAGSYYCIVTNSNGCSATSAAATVSLYSVPSITGPTNQSTCPGVPVSLSVSVSGSNTFQWYSGSVGSGSPISGATSASYSTATAGSYYCIVTNSNGCSATSSAATVSNYSVPSISGPTNQSTCSGYSATLSVSASGGSPFTYQWYNSGGSAISGATSASYSTGTAGSYYCRVTNSSGCSANSGTASVTVYSAPSISGPYDQSTCSGYSTTLSVSSAGATGYQWYTGSGSAISGATSSSYTTGTAGTYYCRVTNTEGCTANSRTATVTVNSPPGISGPTNQTVCTGSSATFSVTASGGSSYSYQWYTGSGSAISGATSSSYTTGTAGSYYCRVTNNYGCSANSSSATLTLNPLPVIEYQPESSSAPLGSYGGFTIYPAGDYLNDYTYQWYFNNQVVTSSPAAGYIMGDGKGYMIYIKADPVTTGNWYCIVTLKSTGCSRQSMVVTYSVSP